VQDWAALQKRAAANTAAQQAELAAKAKARKEAAEQAERLAAQKAQAEKAAAEQRRKEREQRERDRVAEEERRKTALPKTTNLYALKQERIKRGLDPSGKDDHLLNAKVRSMAGRNAVIDRSSADLTLSGSPGASLQARRPQKCPPGSRPLLPGTKSLLFKRVKRRRQRRAMPFSVTTGRRPGGWH
jgi:hypothetical protein